jgi:two-component system phosphate regulon sensor histidine kinase PhoR
VDPSRLIAAIPMACLMIDKDDRIIAANTKALDLLGHGLTGRNYVTMLRQPNLLDAIEATLRDGQAREAQYQGAESGQDTTFRTHCMAVEGAGAVLVSFEDVTQVEQAGQMRRDFVANVSHELRTPLTALMGFIETLRGPAKDDVAARERFLGIMESEAGRMNRLVGDLLSLSRVESDERVRPTETVNIVDVLTSTLHTLKPVADEAKVAFVTEFDVPDLLLTADMDQLIQVFTNLVENAIKYGGSGGEVAVKLSYSAHDTAIRAPSARVQVSDTGPGIDAFHLPRLTERFYRADSHRSRELGGTGLGLAIVKHIVNRHRGRLRVESEPGQGSVFTVILPCHARDDVTA